MLTVNEEPIYCSEFERTKQRYAQTDLTEIELIEGIVLEAIVLGKAVDYNICVSEDEINEIFDGLVSLNGGELFYEKALEFYETDDKIKEAYYYSILYDKVKEKINKIFMEDYSINRKVLEKRTSDYVSQYDFEGVEKEEFIQAVWDTYEEAMQSELFELYFKVWQYNELCRAQIEYVNMDASSLFYHYSYGIDDNYLDYKGEKYKLEEWSYKKAQEVFGNVLYLSSINQENVDIKGVHNTEKDVKTIYVKLQNELSIPIFITVIVSPYISVNYEQQQGTTLLEGVEGTMNKVDIIQHNYGIHYTICSEQEYDDLEHLLYDFIPYEIE